MLDNETKRRIDTARDILVGKVPDPKSQVEQITIALIYKFMDDMDAEAEELGGKRKFFSGDFDRYGWKKLMAPDLGGFDVLTLYAEAIQKMNINPNIPQLFRDIFKNAYLPYRDPETLKSFLKIIDDFEYSHSEKLGDAFEYLLSVLGSQGDAGQFRTPRHIIDFMVDIIDPKKDETILDPACGTAGFLISSYKHILKHNSTNFVPEKDKEAFEQTDVSIAELSAGGIKRYSGDKLTPDERAKLSKNIKGYDISPDMVRLSLVNLYLHGFTDPKIFEYDTLTSEDNWNEYADVVLANPPFMSPKGGIKPHKRFSIQSKRSEVLFVDYMVEHLTPNGKAAIIVPEGIIFQSGNAYKQLRKMLVENYLFAVVSLPAGVFQPYSGVKTSILLIDKALNKKTNKILFVKIENDGFDLGAQRRPNNKSQLPTAVKLVKEYISVCNSALDAESTLTEKYGPNNLWNIATKEKIAENDDWNLSGERYKKTTRLDKTSYEVISLGEVCDIFNGSTPSKQEESFWSNGTIPWFTVDDIRVNGRIIRETQKKITEKALEETSVKLLPRESVLLCCTASVGEYAFTEIELTTNQQFNGLVVKDSFKEKLDPKFLFFLAATFKEELIRLSGQTSFNFVSVKVLKTMKIVLPPLEIQKEIVAEIEGWQKIIDGARQVVENYKPQIDIDPEWPMVELGEVCEINPKKSELAGIDESIEVSFVPMADVNENQIYFNAAQKKNIKDVIGGYTYFKNDDVLLAKVTPCFENGKAGIAKNLVNEIGFGSSELFVLRPNNKIRSHWIYYNIIKNTFRENGKLRMTGTGGLQRVPKDYVSQNLIPLPTIEEQDKIISKIEEELKIVQLNKELITIFEQKIKDKIAKVWGE